MAHTADIKPYVLTGRAQVWHLGPGLASQHVPTAGQPAQGRDSGPPFSPSGAWCCVGAPLPSSSRPQDLLSWGVSEKAHVSPQLLPSSQSSHVNISLLRAQRLGGCVSGPKARQRNVPGAPAPAASAVRGWAGFSGFSQCRAFVLRGNCTEGPGSPVLLGHMEHLWQISPGVLGVPRPRPSPSVLLGMGCDLQEGNSTCRKPAPTEASPV